MSVQTRPAQQPAAEPAAAGAGPGSILAIASGARRAQLLLSAVELGVFDAIGDGGTPTAGGSSAAEVAAATGVHDAWITVVLDGLVALGLLDSGPHGYCRAADAARYLDSSSPEYIGGFLRFLSGTLHPAWAGLSVSLRTGRPADQGADVTVELTDPYPGQYADPLQRKEFLAAMDVLNAPIGRAVAALDWSRSGSVIDVGGAAGGVAIQLARRYPDLTVAVFDLPAVAPEFRRAVQAAHLPETSVTFHGGDFFADEIPAADTVVLGHVLLNWPVERRRRIIAAVHRALPVGGKVLIYDPLLDPANPDLVKVLAALNMLVWSAGGTPYTADDLGELLGTAGFEQIEHTALRPGTVLTTAVKR